ncbi:MAG: hypothetical protein LBM60_04235, partial [Clostridium sp.]|nr:hypothetical protein [Clostridium sp.]
YKFNYEQINEQTPTSLFNEQLHTLIAVANKTPEKVVNAYVDELIKFGYVKKVNDKFVPTIRVVYSNKVKPFTATQELEYNKIIAPATELFESQYQVCREAVLAEVPVFLREDEHQINHAISCLMFPRESVFKEALDIGWLTYDKTDPESAKRRMLGAYLAIE